MDNKILEICGTLNFHSVARAVLGRGWETDKDTARVLRELGEAVKERTAHIEREARRRRETPGSPNYGWD